MMIKNIYDHRFVFNGTQGLFNNNTASLSIEYPNEIQAHIKKCLTSKLKKIMTRGNIKGIGVCDRLAFYNKIGYNKIPNFSANLMIELFRNLLRSWNPNDDNEYSNINKSTHDKGDPISWAIDLLFPYVVRFFNKIFN